MTLRNLVLLALLAATSTSGQLSGSVGPSTSTAAKRAKICNVLDYGGSNGSSDIGPAIQKAFNNCIVGSTSATLYIPPGNYNMQTWVNLNSQSHWALQLDGIITRTGTARGHMIYVGGATDFEFYSSTSAGAIQGNGYQCRNAGPRLVRIVQSTSFSVHDIILVDSPEFHLIVDHGSNGEIYNMAIRGADIGASDGVDISGANHWVHDVEVTNRDECVTVKSPASNFLIERIWCNQSGGSAIGSLSDDTAIRNILYRNVYTNGGNHIFMIKSNMGSGSVENVHFQNFLARDTAYGLDVDQYWARQTPGTGPGVALKDIHFQDWDGYVVDGVRRPTMQFICADGAPCAGITLTNVNLWSATNQAVVKCRSAYGSGSCLQGGGGGSYGIVTSTITQPPAYTTPPSLPGDLASGFATDSPIPIPTIPTTYYPGLGQISPLAKNLGSASATPISQGASPPLPAPTTSKPAITTAPSISQ